MWKSVGHFRLTQRLGLALKIRMTPRRMNDNPIISSSVDFVFKFPQFVPSVISFHLLNICSRNEAVELTGVRPHTGRAR